MNYYRLTLAGMAIAAAMLSAHAYDISVRNADGQIFRATVDDLENITFDTAGSPLTFIGNGGSSFEAGCDAEDIAVKFDASMYWIVSNVDDNASWMRISKNYGIAGENTIVVSLDANPLNAPRTASFTVLCGFQPVKITITQNSKGTSGFVEIPDDNFRAYILRNFDTNSDGKISHQEAEAITEINCREKEIKSMAGIRSMSNLTTLDCSYNEIEGTLDLSGLTKLKTANVDHNRYESLSLSGCSALETLYANDNWQSVNYQYFYMLKNIDLTGCSALKYVRLEDNALESIDLSDCSSLTDMFLISNNLKSIDVSACKNLVNLHLRKNKLSGTVDMAALPNLEYLSLSEIDDLSGINLTGCSKLRQLTASYTSISAIDLSDCKSLETLEIFGCKLSSIDLKNNPDLRSLWVSSNQLTALDVTGNPRLTKLRGGNNAITGTLDMSANSELELFEMNDNQIEEVKFATAESLNSINLNNNKIRNLDLKNVPNINSLVAYGNEITSVDLSKQAKMTILNLDDNLLTGLDLSGCEMLMSADINKNKLKSLDVSGCTSLVELYITFNEITDFKANNLKNFTTLEIYNNKLDRIDLKGCTKLSELHFHNNNVQFFSPKGLDALRYIDCRNNKIESIDFSSNGSLQYAHGTGNPCKIVYLNEEAPNEQIVFDESCKIVYGHPKDYDDVGTSNWGDGKVDPWAN